MNYTPEQLLERAARNDEWMVKNRGWVTIGNEDSDQLRELAAAKEENANLKGHAEADANAGTETALWSRDLHEQ